MDSIVGKEEKLRIGCDRFMPQALGGARAAGVDVGNQLRPRRVAIGYPKLLSMDAIVGGEEQPSARRAVRCS